LIKARLSAKENYNNFGLGRNEAKDKAVFVATMIAL
jgi:hypothetical protein